MHENRFAFKTLAAMVSVFTVMLFALSMGAAGARNDDVPSSWLSFRSRLLKQRDQLLSNKADQMRCWNEDESTLKLLDQAMTLQLSAGDRQTVIAARAARMSCIGAHRATMNAVDRAIIDVDKDLSYIEGQITNIACQR